MTYILFTLVVLSIQPGGEKHIVFQGCRMRTFLLYRLYFVIESEATLSCLFLLFVLLVLIYVLLAHLETATV